MDGDKLPQIQRVQSSAATTVECQCVSLLDQVGQRERIMGLGQLDLRHLDFMQSYDLK